MSKDKKDHGQHYRFSYNGINLDPFRICQTYNVSDFALQTIVKKALCAGGRGHKDFRQDLLDIICAAERRLEMLDEDNVEFTLPSSEPKQSPQSPDNLPWIKNTGTMPDHQKVRVKFDNGKTSDGMPEMYNWRLNDSSPIIEYQSLDHELKLAGDPEPKQELVWIKNTGVEPNCKRVLVRFLDRDIAEDKVSEFDWILDGSISHIVEYLILE